MWAAAAISLELWMPGYDWNRWSFFMLCWEGIDGVEADGEAGVV